MPQNTVPPSPGTAPDSYALPASIPAAHQTWAPSWCRSLNGIWIGYEHWAVGGVIGHGAWVPGSGPISGWVRGKVPADRPYWWTGYQHAMRGEVYRAGCRVADRSWQRSAAADAATDELIAKYAEAGQPLTGDVIETFAAGLDLAPVPPGTLAAPGSWDAHLAWLAEIFGSRRFAASDVLAAARDAGAWESPPGYGLAVSRDALRLSRDYGAAEGMERGGLILAAAGRPHGTRHWMVVPGNPT